MFNRVFNNDSIHTKGAYEIDRQVRARQRQMSMHHAEDEVEITFQTIHMDKPKKGRLAGMINHMWLLFGI